MRTKGSAKTSPAVTPDAEVRSLPAPAAPSLRDFLCTSTTRCWDVLSIFIDNRARGVVEEEWPREAAHRTDEVSNRVAGRIWRNFWPDRWFHSPHLMKTIFFTLIIALGGLSGVQAEGPDTTSDSRRGPGGEMRKKMKEKFLESLPPEARQRFEAAREKALQDPAVQELRKKSETANREFFDAMRKKMLEIDPSLAEIVKNARGGKGPGEMREDRREGNRGPGGFGDLTDVERQKLMAAREKARTDPAVVAAEKMKGEAGTPEARKAASEEYRKAMHTALLKADPTLGPILEKMVPKAPPAPPVPGGDGEMMSNP